MTMVCPSRAGLPVPSTTRTCRSTTSGPSTATNGSTRGPRARRRARASQVDVCMAGRFTSTARWAYSVMMRRSLVAVLFAAASCGGGEECRPASLVRIDEARRCGLPIAEVPGLSFCHPAGQERTKGVRPICVYDGHTRYVGYIATDEHIPGGTF